MPLQKQNLLSVRYDLRKGLILKWNFSDIFCNHKYFHHLFIIYNTNRSFIHILLHVYYKKMKYGDLISILYCDQQKHIKQLKWIEKTLIQTLNIARIVEGISSQPLNEQTCHQLTQKAREVSKDNNQHLIVNILLSDQHLHKEKIFVEIIQKARRQSSFNYICTLFGSFKTNDITFNEGINFINTDNTEFDQSDYQVSLGKTISFYHMMINSATIKRISITIQCMRGQLLIQDDKIWKNPSFNRIQRNFYGPSSNYQQDKIYFLLMDSTQRNELEMLINLEIIQFSNQKYTSSKRIKLNIPDDVKFTKSLNFSAFQRAIRIQGVEIQRYPFSTESFVKVFNQDE